MSRLSKYWDKIMDDEPTFQDKELFPGWMIVNTEQEHQYDSGKKKKTFTWEARTPEDCLNDILCFVKVLSERLSSKFNEAVREQVQPMAVLDLETLLLKLSMLSMGDGVHV